MQSLRLAISPPPLTISPFSQPHVHSSAYDRFMQEPYRAADCSSHLQGNGSNLAKWVSGLNRVLCVALSSELSVDYLPSLLENRSPQENRAISHFIDATLAPDFALFIGVVLSCTTAKEFFDAIKTRCQLKPNTTIILMLQKSFSLFKKLGVEADELERLFAQAVCHASPTLDQLVTSAIMARGSKKPLSTFVGQAILNALPATDGPTQHSSPFIYRVSDPPGLSHFQSRPRSPFSSKPTATRSETTIASPLAYTSSCHSGAPTTTSSKLPLPEGACVASQTKTLKILVKRGYVIVHDVAFSTKISGTILSVGRLCRAGVVPFFENLLLSLLVSGMLVSTTFRNDFWWMDVVPGGETKVSAAASSPPVCFEMNPISFPDSKTMSPREWHEHLGHASDRVVVSFLKQHVPSFNPKCWQPFYCDVCAKSKSTHRLAKACTDIPKNKPLDLLVSDVMGPFPEDAQAFDAPAAILDAINQLRVRTKVAPKALRTDNAQEFTLASCVESLAKLGVSFCPSLPYSLQENGEAERLNGTLGDMARAMLTQSGMPTCLWQFAYASACFIHNRIPNSRCLNSSPFQQLYGQPPSIAAIYPFGGDALVHIPTVHQCHKLDARAIECKLLKPLLSGGWLLWEPNMNKMVQSASVIFPQFQPANTTRESSNKGSLHHIVNEMSLGQVPTEKYFKLENQAIDSIVMAKDINILTHLGKALSGAYQESWRVACQVELNQMATRDVWEVLPKLLGMKIIGRRWVFDLKRNLDSTVEKFKARLVARGDRQRPGVDCAKMYTPTASLMSLHLLLGIAVLKGWKVASFDVSGAYFYIPVEECVLIEPPVDFLPTLRGKVLRLKKALYGMCQAGRCWWKFLLGILERLGFVATEVDQSLYIFRNGVAVIAIWIHVDDDVITSNTPSAISDFQKALCTELNIKWWEKLTQIVGLECVIGEGEVVMTQKHLTEGILEAYPQHLIQRDAPLLVLSVGGMTTTTKILDPTPFRSVIGLLAYLISETRPDLAFAVNYLARHSVALTTEHWELLGNVVGYLLKTCDRGLRLCPGKLSLNLWSDVGWGGDLERLQKGFIIKLGEALILWASK
ncbi:hypothetical protein O181_024946 [Austropuccinia psidii MF-1]|uniref:Integrase catalytic domain-containing protein n=1 Tax=Austropuccinia psidii MF-1 TaxID=1389203 RepID=A0A9Q3GZ33_9BASI|nr:hypothetical protein [Austropuccinia psidii MF-1]